jgi:hypothetical protein
MSLERLSVVEISKCIVTLWLKHCEIQSGALKPEEHDTRTASADWSFGTP